MNLSKIIAAMIALRRKKEPVDQQNNFYIPSEIEMEAARVVRGRWMEEAKDYIFFGVPRGTYLSSETLRRVLPAAPHFNMVGALVKWGVQRSILKPVGVDTATGASKARKIRVYKVV